MAGGEGDALLRRRAAEDALDDDSDSDGDRQAAQGDDLLSALADWASQAKSAADDWASHALASLSNLVTASGGEDDTEAPVLGEDSQDPTEPNSPAPKRSRAGWDRFYEFLQEHSTAASDGEIHQQRIAEVEKELTRLKREASGTSQLGTPGTQEGEAQTADTTHAQRLEAALMESWQEDPGADMVRLWLLMGVTSLAREFGAAGNGVYWHPMRMPLEEGLRGWQDKRLAGQQSDGIFVDESEHTLRKVMKITGDTLLQVQEFHAFPGKRGTEVLQTDSGVELHLCWAYQVQVFQDGIWMDFEYLRGEPLGAVLTKLRDAGDAARLLAFCEVAGPILRSCICRMFGVLGGMEIEGHADLHCSNILVGFRDDRLHCVQVIDLYNSDLVKGTRTPAPRRRKAWYDLCALCDSVTKRLGEQGRDGAAAIVRALAQILGGQKGALLARYQLEELE